MKARTSGSASSSSAASFGSVGGLLHERPQVHHLIGHRWFLGGESSMTTREAARPLRRYMRARVRAASLPPSYTITRDVTQ